MAEETVICPKCGAEIPLGEAFRSRIEEHLRHEFEKRLAAESHKAHKQAEEEHALAQANLVAELQEKARTLEESRKRELHLLRQNRELEEAKKTVELQVARRVQEEKAILEKAVRDRLGEEHRLRDLEKDKQLTDLRRQIEDLKKKAEQGSQQSQGEVAELDLEAFLRATFPQDEIEPVPKGVRGADLVHRVIGPAGKACGSIVWEAKNTRAWSDAWLGKLRDDQRELRADIAAIVTTVLPKSVRNAALIEGVWVTDMATLQGLATALRSQLVQVAVARATAQGRGSKMDLLYDYLTGTEFRQRVEAVLEAFVGLKDDLERERRAMESAWAKREKQLGRAISGLAGMYGDMQGIVGASLPRVARLELGSGDAEAQSDADRPDVT